MSLRDRPEPPVALEAWRQAAEALLKLEAAHRWAAAYTGWSALERRAPTDELRRAADARARMARAWRDAPADPVHACTGPGCGTVGCAQGRPHPEVRPEGWSPW